MRVVLVVPSSAVFESMGPTLMRTAMLMPPVGVVGLASYLEVNGVEVAVVDAVTQRLDAGKCAQRISELQPDLVGFSALTWSFYYVTQTISALRCKLPDVPVVLGNIHA